MLRRVGTKTIHQVWTFRDYRTHVWCRLVKTTSYELRSTKGWLKGRTRSELQRLSSDKELAESPISGEPPIHYSRRLGNGVFFRTWEEWKPNARQLRTD